MSESRERHYLEDIIMAAGNIARYVGRGRAAFDGSELIQVWMIYHLQIIGEAARSLSPELKAAHPEVPWREINAMRNILIHRYFGTDADEVWRAAEDDIPVLRDRIQLLLQAIDGDEG